MTAPYVRETEDEEAEKARLRMAQIADWMRRKRSTAPRDATRAPTRRVPTMGAADVSRRGGLTGYDIPEPSLGQQAAEAGASWLPPVDVPMAYRGARKAMGGDAMGGAGMMALSLAGMVPAGKIIAKGAEKLGVKALGEAAGKAVGGAARVEETAAPAEKLGRTRLDDLLAGRTGPAVRKPVTAWEPYEHGIFPSRKDFGDNQGTVQAPDYLNPGGHVPSRFEGFNPLVEMALDSKKVKRDMLEDGSRGSIMGGKRWYNTKGIQDRMNATPGAMSFDEWNMTNAATSASNSVMGELSGASIINFARKNGLDLDEAKQLFDRVMTEEAGFAPRPLLYGSHADRAQRFVDKGIAAPRELIGNEWKIPGYSGGRAGMGSQRVGDAGSIPALDRHERRKILTSLIDESPSARQKVEQHFGRSLAPDDVLPLKNSLDYFAASTLYEDLAKQLDLPTVQAAQATRWTGGFDSTGLQSPAYGDFQQILEDLIAYNAMKRKKGTDVKSLNKFADDYFRGQEMLMPWTQRGQIPRPSR